MSKHWKVPCILPEVTRQAMQIWARLRTVYTLTAWQMAYDKLLKSSAMPTQKDAAFYSERIAGYRGKAPVLSPRDSWKFPTK